MLEENSSEQETSKCPINSRRNRKWRKKRFELISKYSM